MRWVLLCILASCLGATEEVCDPRLSSECDATPLLQVTRRPAHHLRNFTSPPQSLGGAVIKKLGDVIDHNADVLKANDTKEKKEWPFVPDDPSREPAPPKQPMTEEEKKVRRKVLARQAVTAAGLIMALMTFSVGMQLIMVEFVMTGTCAMPFTIAGMMGTVILGVISGFRYLFRVPYRILVSLCQHCRTALYASFCCSCCRRSDGKDLLPLSQACPDHLLEEVVGFLPVEALSAFSCTSRKMQDVAHSSTAVPALMGKVEGMNLQKRWKRHLQRFEEASMPSESSESGISEESRRTSSPESSLEEKAHKGVAVIKELHRFLCRQMRRSAEKESAHEMQEQWNVITDFVRYVMLVIGWFWFSAEVMDMACSDDATGPFHILKALSSPAIFLFILESDRSQFWWQVVAGLCAFMLLMDLLFDSFQPLK